MILLHKKTMHALVMATSIFCGTQITASQQPSLALAKQQEAKSQFLYNHARKLSIPTMQKLISEGADVNYGEKKSNLPILMLTFPHYNKMKFLLENGADVNASYEFNEEDGTVTALKYALNNNDHRILRLLLPYKPEFNHPSTIIKKNDLIISQLFIKSGNLTANEYCTCISECLSDGKIELAALFIKAYKPGQKAIRFFKRLRKIKCKTETISFMQKFNKLSNQKFSELIDILNDPRATQQLFLTHNNINQYSIKSAQNAIQLLRILKLEVSEKTDQNEILLFMDQLNNLLEDEFSNLTDYLKSQKLETAILACNPCD